VYELYTTNPAAWKYTLGNEEDFRRLHRESQLLQFLQYLPRISSIENQHLDIKIDNILFTEDDRPIVIDFGLSKKFDFSSTDAEPSNGGTNSRLPKNFSQGISEVFSLGIVFTQMFMRRITNFFLMRLNFLAAGLKPTITMINL